MTFQEVKDAILSNAAKVDVCGQYHDILLSLTFDDIANAGLPLLEWAYRTGIIDDVLISEFPSLILSTNNIFTTGTHVVTNPTSDVYCFGNSNVTINLTGNNKTSVFSVTSGTLIENLSNSSYVRNRIHSGIFRLNATDKSVSYSEIKNTDDVQIVCFDDSVNHFLCHENANILFKTTENAFIKGQGFYNSKISGDKDSTVQPIIELSQYSTYQDFSFDALFKINNQSFKINTNILTIN